MTTLKQRVENHPAVFFFGAILAGFVAGIGAYQGILEISGRTTVSKDYLKSLERVDPLALMGKIDYGYDRHGIDIDNKYVDVFPRVPELCRMECAEREACEAWAYQSPKKAALLKCWVKYSDPGNKVDRKGFSSGVKNPS